jgi:hypothetical protein
LVIGNSGQQYVDRGFNSLSFWVLRKPKRNPDSTATDARVVADATAVVQRDVDRRALAAGLLVIATAEKV